MIYNNTEFYVQDNWKVNSRLTLDYGIRFTHQQPQYDQFQQMSNFFPDQWSASQAPTLYAPAASANACVRQRAYRPAHRPDPHDCRACRTRRRPSARRSPASGNLNNGISAGGRRHREDQLHLAEARGRARASAWPTTSPATRRLILRGGGGIFYDRPDGNTVFSIPGNPPIASAQDLRSGQLQNVGGTGGLQTIGVPGLVTFQYDAKVPASWQWQAGVQMALPWAASARRLLRRQPRLQPPRRLPGRHDGQPERGRHRRGLPAAEPGPDADQHGPGREHDRQPAAAVPRAGQHQPEHHRVPRHVSLHPDQRSTAGSATASRSA